MTNAHSVILNNEVEPSLNVYTIHVEVISNDDRSDVTKFNIRQEARSLNKAFDLCEEKVKVKYPDHIIEMTNGNRQPLHLREHSFEWGQPDAA